MKCPKCQTENPTESKFCSNCATSLSVSERSQEDTPETQFLPILSLTPGTTFAGRYRVIEELGRGGMGQVYRVYDSSLNEEIALKIIRPDIASDTEALERFRNELKLARKISHKNVGRMYELMEENDAQYITMEYVPGEDLKSMIRMMGRMSPGQTAAIAKQVCEGLAEAHRLGVVHLDIKPSNIMIDKQGYAHIMDFGIARLVKSKGKPEAGLTVGTPEYMSPEQAEGKDTDPRSDIYSLGIVLYKMLTGKLPFKGDTPLSTAMKHCHEAPENPKNINPLIPNDLNDLVLKCLEKDKEKRFQTIKQLLAELTVIEESIPTTDKKTPGDSSPTSKEITVSFRLNKLLVPILALLVVAAVTIGIMSFLPSKDTIQHSVAVVAFENKTGEPSYDYLQKAIPNLLITGLEQSKYLKVTSWEQMHDLLKLEGMEETDSAQQEQAYDLYQREGIEYIVQGGFTKADNLFATDIRLVDTTTRRVVKSASSTGEGVGSILREQIDKLSREISRGVGLSEKKIATEPFHISEMTTDSMEAYNYFLRGQEDFEKFYFNDARRFLERAVELDPEFALAHSYLYRTLLALGDITEAEKSLEKFKEYAKNVKGKEGEYLRALSAQLVDRNMGLYGRLIKDLTIRYPKDKRFHFDLAIFHQNQNNLDEMEKELLSALDLDPQFGYAINYLAYLYMGNSEFEKALTYFTRYASVSPGDANPFDSMGELYFHMGRYEESIEKYKEALAVKPDFGSEWKLAYIYAMRNDYRTAIEWAEQADEAAITDSQRSIAYQWKGYYLYVQGKLEQALLAFDQSTEYAQKAEQPRVIDIALRMKLWICYDWENNELFHKYFQERVAYRIEQNIGSKNLNQIISLLYQGLLELRSEQTNAARDKLAEMKKLIKTLENEEKNIQQKGDVWLLWEILLAEGKTEEAIQTFVERKIIPLNFIAFTSFLRPNAPFILDFPARALAKKSDPQKAISTYENLISSTPDQRGHLHIHPIAHYRLAKLYEKAGQQEKAAEQYGQFLTFCSEADPGLTAVEDARKRSAELKNPNK